MFSDYNYISDSNFNFKKKDPFEIIDRIEDTMSPNLLHPMHYSKTGWEYDAIFTEAFKLYIKTIHNNFLINPTYKSQVGDSLIEKFKKEIIMNIFVLNTLGIGEDIVELISHDISIKGIIGLSYRKKTSKISDYSYQGNFCKKIGIDFIEVDSYNLQKKR